ncbi:MAG: TonB-dependent receptor [Vicinamibacterales bacterium]
MVAADGTAIAGASVTLAGAEGRIVQQGVADAEGRFLLPIVKPGRYELRVTRSGFAERALPLPIEPREVRDLVIRLDVAAVSVTVDVTAVVVPAGTHSPSSTVLDAERVNTLSPVLRTNLTEAIVTLAPGMIRGHDDFVHIRGHEVALNPLINGVAFWENPHALFSSGFSPEIIDTANVMTGGFPAEYGNRFGGVIDVVTKSGASMGNSGSVALSAGGAGRKGASGEFGGSRGRLGYYLFAAAFTSERFLSPPDPRAIHDGGLGGRGFGQVDWATERAGALRLTVAGDALSFEIPKTPSDMAYRAPAEPEQRNRQQTAILGWIRAGSATVTSASFYQRWSRTRLEPATGPLTAAAGLTRALRTLGIKGDVTRASGPHTWKAGVDIVSLRPTETLDYQYDGYRELTHLLGLPHMHIHGNRIQYTGRDSGGQVSAFVQDSLRLGSRVMLDLGVRVDRYDMVTTASHASPRANLAVQVGRGAVVHASYNRFFVSPPIEGVLSSSAGLTADISEIGRALPPIEPTVEDQGELGISAPVGPLRVVATGYLRTTDNPVHTTVWPDSRIYSYASFDRGKAYGLELKAEAPGLARLGLTAYANYSLGRAWFFNPVTGGFVTEAGHITDTNRFLAPMDQTHTFTGGITYRHASSGTWFGTTLEYGSGTPIGHVSSEHAHADGEADHEDASSGGASRVLAHLTGNLSFGVDLLRRAAARSPLTLQVDVENISDNVYLIATEGEFSPRQYAAPRLVTLSVRYRF